MIEKHILKATKFTRSIVTSTHKKVLEHNGSPRKKYKRNKIFDIMFYSTILRVLCEAAYLKKNRKTGYTIFDKNFAKYFICIKTYLQS